MSSHREAPGISKDPVADNTDTYAFVSPDAPNTVTLITNYLPLEAPFGGPNFFEFGDDVLYYIFVDNDGDGQPNVTYEFSFETQIRNEDTFLYNTGQIDSIDSPNWNRRQFYSVTRIKNGHRKVLATQLACPPCNIGPSSTPNYPALAAAAIHTIGGGAYSEKGPTTVFAGQRLEGFYVDLGSIFDLADLRPLSSLHVFSMVGTPGVDSTQDFSVHSIAIQLPISDLTRNGDAPTDIMSPDSVIGVWGAAARQKTTIRDDKGGVVNIGKYQQVSRLGNPLFNEVIVPMGKKDLWNSQSPADDSQFLQYVQKPELANLLPVLYPGVFPKLAALDASTATRDDLVAVLLTGLPPGVVKGFQNYTGGTYADYLRLNVAVPPTTVKPNPIGLVAGDPAGFPNGRRVFDDIVTVELQAVAGLTYPLVMPSYQPDAAVPLITDGLTDASSTYLSSFPYLGNPQGGYQTSPLGTVA